MPQMMPMIWFIMMIFFYFMFNNNYFFSTFSKYSLFIINFYKIYSNFNNWNWTW